MKNIFGMQGGIAGFIFRRVNIKSFTLLLTGLLLVVANAFGQTEICNDGVDNNGDGKIDCADIQCTFAPTIEKGCNCYDGKDNDGNGKIDAADPSCAGYYGMTFVGQGTNCSINPPPGTAFSTVAPPQTSAQNTADTPAKIVVGDMNHDGVPDVVVTSKWNSTIQVVATTTVGTWKPGDIMGDFRTPGSKIFPKAGSNYVFEHEVAIADIDKDGIGEMFAIASERGGSPNNKPVRFFLTGFEYANKNLNPLWNAVDLGPDRPGSIGVADFDGDGKAEVYLRNQIYAAESGKKLADQGGTWDTQINSAPVAVNILGDSKLELVCGNFIYGVPSLAARAFVALSVLKDMNTIGATKFYPKGFNDVNEYGVDQASSTSTADFDGDGFIDVFMTGAINCSGNEAAPCGNNVTTIFYWNVQKNTISTYAPPDPTYPATGWAWGTGRINLGDANGDGKLEALFLAGSQLFCLGADAAGNLTQLWVRTINDPFSGILALTVYDFENDGKPEVVYRDTQELVITDGQTGQVKKWSAPCSSHTWTEGPVVADVNGDGNTDICVPCYTNGAITTNTAQQQSLGQTRLYYSSTNAWIPTRQVWNQHGYFVTNINDNLTLPFPQLNPSLIFSNAPCPSGLPGPQRPFNLFMNQVPHLSASGCPEFPAPDLTYFGDDPANPGVDSNGDGVYSPAVVVTPPVCGNLDIKVNFNIINNGDLPISDVVPVSFFNGDPTVSPVTAVKLFNTTLNIVNLGIGQKLVTPTITFNGPGTAFKLYIVLYNDGSSLPINLTGQSTKECTISNNIYSVQITPTPFTATIEKVSDNIKCLNSAPDTGQLKAHVFKGGVEQVDLSPYKFQWYTGAGTGSPIAAPNGTNYLITGLAEGTYTLVVSQLVTDPVTKVTYNCASTPVQATLVRIGEDPTINISVISHQTVCSPPNGKLQADLAGLTPPYAGYTFAWYDVALNNLGISGNVATNLVAGNYLVQVKTPSGCVKLSNPATVNGPQIPDANASTLQNVVDCSNPNSGSVTANALFNGVVQNPANYTFDWYFYNNATSTRGSILPPANGTGQTRTGLAVGYYQVVVTDNTSKCVAGVSPITQVQSQTVIPTAQITQLAPQTSCDPLNPNGILQGDAVIGGVVQNPASFTFQWFKGNNTLPANLVATTSGTNGQVVNKVAGGGIPYTVKVTTALNCSATTNFIIAENLQQPVVTLTPTPNSICNPALASSTYNGIATAAVTFGGVGVAPGDPNYTYAWHKGSLSTDPTPSPNSTTNVLSQQNGGNYTLVVTRTDLSCVSNPVTTTITNTTVLPVLTTSAIASTNCVAGKENGTAQVVTVDGAAVGTVNNYKYQWYTGAGIGSPIAVGTNPTATSAALTKVQGGAANNYTVQVTNSNSGCQNTATVNVPDGKVLPILSLTPTSNGICNPALTVPAVTYSGTVTAAVTNQIGPLTDYTFSFGGGMNVGVASANIYSQLNGGATPYTATTTHTPTGCVSSVASATVTNVQAIPVLTTGSIPSTNCAAGKEDGKAQVLTVDGTPVASAIGYTYSWAGSVAPAFPVNVATNNSNTATLIKVQGGAGYNYVGTVTNQANGCQSTASVNVADGKQIPVITLAVTDNGICNPALTSPAKTYSGKITATITNQVGALSNYTFAFGAGMGPGVATANVYDQLNGGATPYTAQTTSTVTGCTSAIVNAVVNNVQAIPVLTTGATASTNCVPGKEDGVAQVLTVDGTAVGAAVGYTYNWIGPVAPAFPVSSGGNNSNTFTLIKVQGGAGYNYTITVTNQSNGCQGTTAVNVPDGKQQPLLTLTPTNNGICNPALTVPVVSYSGKITGAVTNQVGPLTDYTFSFGGGMGAGVTTANVYSQLNGGATPYTATVTHNITGCQSAQVTAVVANVQAFPVLTTSTTPSTNCVPGKEDGVAQVLTVDGTAVGSASGYTYSWAGPVTFPVNAGTNNSNTPVLIKVQGGTGYDYAGTVTNQSNGCQTTVSLNVTDGKQAPLLSLATVDNGICTPALTSPAKTYSGKITATVTNQVGLLSNYVFTFGGGTSVGVATGNVYDQLNGGATPYTAIVTHTVTGCVSAQSTAVVNNVQSLPVLTTGATPSTNCTPGLENGLAQVVTVDGSAVGVATGYTYSWIGPVAPAFPVNAGTNNSNTATLIKVQGGAGYNYAVTVTNQGNGCQTINSVNVPDSKAQPTFTLTPQPNTVCDKTIALSGAFDGQVQADVNAAGNYATSVNGDFSYAWSTGVSGTGVNLITGLDVGTYTLTATHIATGCQSILYSSQVLDSKVLPTISTTSVGSTNCAGGVANGSASVTGVLPVGKTYDYRWYNGNSTAAPPGPVTLSTGLTTNTYANVQGGLNGASLIQYTVQVTILQSGCINTATIGVSDDSQVPVLGPLTSTDNTFCVGSNGTAATTTLSYRGSAQVSPFPGFAINWSNGDTGIATTTPLPAGNYTVTATKTGDNCTSNPVSVTIKDNLYNPVINMTETPQSSCDLANPNGQLFATVDETSIGGAASVTAGYTFTWKNRGNPYGSANTSPNFVAPNGINQLAGNIYYEVTVVRNVTGCSNIQSHELTESIVVPTVSLGGIANQTSCSTPDGSVTATVGTPPVTTTYTYFWLREQAGQTTNDPNTVITTVQANLGAGFYNKINTAASNVNTLGGTVNGRYTVVVQDDYNKCVSQPVFADIADDTQSTITISIGALPNSCASFGALTMNAVRVSAPPSTKFDFQVFRGGPVNAVLPIDYYSNPTNPPAFGAGSIETLNGINSGTNVTTAAANTYNSDLYTVVATDDFGCKNYNTFFLPFQDAHGVDAIPTNVTNCTVDNGAIAMRAIFPTTGPGIAFNQSNYQFTFYSGGLPNPANRVDLTVAGSTFNNPYVPDTNPNTTWPVSTEKCNTPLVDSDGDGIPAGSDLDCIGRITTSANLPVGFYLLQIKDKSTGCNVYQSVELKQDARPVVLDIVGSLSANTACNVLQSDGKAVVSIAKDPADNVVAAVTYSMNVVPAPLIGAYPMAVALGNQTIQGLKPDTSEPSYTVTVTSSNNCVSTQTISIPDQPVVGQLVSGNVSISDAQYCTAALEQSAKVVVNSVVIPGGAGPENIADYNFQWFTDATLTTMVFNLQGNAAALTGGDEFINQTPGPANGTVASGTVTVGDYYVRAIKTADASGTGGKGCTTAPFTINIADKSVKPTITLTPNSNTSCDPAFFEGSINVKVTTASGPGNVPGNIYDYNWNPAFPVAGAPSNSVNNDGNNNPQPNIGQGTYQLTATNTVTGCSNVLSTTVVRDTPPVFTLTATPSNLTNCGPFDGKILVNNTFADGVAEAMTDFNFVWYKNDPNTAAVLDGTLGAPVDTQLDNVTYPTIALDKYFVVAVRKAGVGAVPGAGCKSAPLRKDILDARVYPVIALTSLSSTSCDTNYDGQITTTASTTGFGPATNYNFHWTGNPGGAVVVTDFTGVSPFIDKSIPLGGPTDKLGPGIYTMRVTNMSNNCFTDGNVTLEQNTIPVNVATATSSPLTNCTVLDGSVTVTGMTVGGSAAALADFTYNWRDNLGGPVGVGTTVNNLTFGDYLVTATKSVSTTPSSGCSSAPFKVTIQDNRAYPVVTMTPVSSTSCDTNYDGQITVSASTTGYGGATNYNFHWTANPGGAVVVTDFTGVSPFIDKSIALGGATDKLGPGAYTMRVTNQSNNCFTDAGASLQQNTIPIDVATATSSPLTNCTVLNGSVTVLSMTVGGAAAALTDFTYNWKDNLGGPAGAGTTVNNLNFGDYFVTATKSVVAPITASAPGSGCSSAPFKVTILDNRAYPVVTMTPVSSTSCDTNYDGQITVSASTSGFGGATNYNFHWTSNPGGAVVVTDRIGTSPFIDQSIALGGATDKLGPGAYTMRVTNQVNNCFTDAGATIQQNTIPITVATASSLPLTHCTVPDGQVSVTAVNTGGVPEPMANLSFQWIGTGGPYNTSTVNGLTAGDYIVTIQKTVAAPPTSTTPASGCSSAPFTVTVKDTRQFPVVSMSTIANTSCDLNYNGSITVTANTSGMPGANYNFIWTSDPDGLVLNQYKVTDGMATTSPYTTLATDKVGSSGIPYIVQVTNLTNMCNATASTTMQQNTLPVQVVTASAINQTKCIAPFDGQVTVSGVNVGGVAEPIGNLTFLWTGPGGPYNTQTVPALAAGNYILTATKNVVGPASGCSSAPYTVTVLDTHVTPVLSFATIANSACDINYDGSITVTATTSGFPSGSTFYDFDWTSVPGLSSAADALNVLSPYTTTAGDKIGAGTYNITVTNKTSGCFVNGSVTIVDNPQTLDVLAVTTTDQLTCNPGGSIAVSSLSSGAVGNYSYSWYRTDPATAALLDGLGNPISVPNLVPGGAATQYPTMGSGTFYVTAKKNAGLTPGSGCVTPAFRVDIKDLHVDPQVQFSFTSNSSCDVTNPNGTLLATASEKSGPTGDTYSFAWTYNGGALPPVTVSTNPTISSNQLTKVFEGNYVVIAKNTTGTGCSVSASVTVDLNQDISKPNIINVNTVDPVTCLPAGSATVASLSIGGGPAITGPALATNFTYEWYKDDFIPADIIVGQTLPSLNNISPASYFVTVKDNATQCQSVARQVDINKTAIVYPQVGITQTAKQISCIAANGTAALLSLADGQNDTNANYQFTWYNTLDFTGPVFANTSTISNLKTGNFSLSVLNVATGCTGTALFIVPDESPLFTPVPSVKGDPRTFCVGVDGDVLIRVVNIDPNYPFPYNFKADLYFSASPNPASPPDIANLPFENGFTTNFVQTGLDIGFYTGKITDNNTGCFALATTEIKDQRTKPVIAVVEDAPMTNCDPGIANGQLSATADNGKIQGYSFQWYPGNAVTGATVSSINKLIGQTAGPYVVRVTNAITGCFDDKGGTITDKTVKPFAPTATVLQDRTSCISPNGWVTADVGGSLLYYFKWYNGAAVKSSADHSDYFYNNVDVGSYTVTATDPNTGCVSPPATVDVKDKRVTPQFVLSSTPSYCTDSGRDPVGTITLQVTSTDTQIEDVVYTLAGTTQIAGHGAEVNGLWPGFYQADVTSVEGCKNSAQIEIKTEISPFNGISLNGDGKNDFFIVDCISLFPNNNVKIFNRSGIKVFEANGYNNVDNVFRGLGEQGLYSLGNELPDGTYYYIIDKRDGSKPVAGFLELLR